MMKYCNLIKLIEFERKEKKVFSVDKKISMVYILIAIQT